MLEIIVFSLGLMYSPGPVNMLAMNLGMNGHFRTSIGFFLGVGSAMLILFVVFGYTGAWLVDERNRLILSVLGCLYIFYLSIKLGRSAVTFDPELQSPALLSYRDGLMIQFLNPKGMITTLPIATIQFPAAGITGWSILLWSVVLSMLAFGAPGTYALMGKGMMSRITQTAYLKYLNIAMAVMLFLVACDIAYEQVYLSI
ncbi:LysE family translocator [Hahella ganghwensis]|uniref:LysE family translocator n=1 Tax=Hahella ganghwensis TaxID=286420 RepID=UPI00037E41AB|nr:LysE family transporter [Hahella ganghwensis]